MRGLASRLQRGTTAQRDWQQAADIAAIRVSGTWPALTSEHWIGSGLVVQGRGAGQGYSFLPKSGLVQG